MSQYFSTLKYVTKDHRACFLQEEDSKYEDFSRDIEKSVLWTIPGSWFETKQDPWHFYLPNHLDGEYYESLWNNITDSRQLKEDLFHLILKYGNEDLSIRPSWSHYQKIKETKNGEEITGYDIFSYEFINTYQICLCKQKTHYFTIQGLGKRKICPFDYSNISPIIYKSDPSLGSKKVENSETE